MDVEGAPREERSPGWLRFIIGRNPTVTFIRILFVTVATIIAFKFVLLPIRVTGNSMFPTYKNGQIRLVNRLSYRRAEPQRGDVVATEFQGKRVVLLKRIVGLPGERFHVFDGNVYINGERLDEPYAHGKILAGNTGEPGSTRKVIELGPTEYMVIGDNRPISEGFVKDRSQLIGKVL